MITGIIIGLTILLIIPWGLIVFAARVAQRRLKRGGDRVWVWYRFNRFITYTHAVYFVPFLAGSAGLGFALASPFATSAARAVLPITLGFVVLAYTLLRAGYALTSYSIRVRVGGSPSTRWRTVRRSGVRALLTASGYALFYLTIALDPRWTIAHPVVSSLYVMAIIAVVSVIGADTIHWWLRAKPIQIDQVPESWRKAAEDFGLGNVSFYLWRTGPAKIVNAMATGFVRKKVVVTDALQTELTASQVEAAVLHEFGHHKKHHLWWQLGVLEMWIPLVQWLTHLFTLMGASAGLTLFGQGIFLVVYQGLGMKWLSRRFEFQADGFAARHLAHPENLAAGLERITTVSIAPMRYPAFDELWMTHPSTEKRVRHIHSFRTSTGTQVSEGVQ